MAAVECMFSEFLRHPRDVVAELGEGDVVLRRRNAPALRLVRADRHEERSAALEASTRLLRNVALHSPAALSGALADAFPWVEFLPEREREVFAEGLTRTMVAASSVDNCAPFAQLIREWRATAEICADPELARRLAAPIDDPTGDPVLVPPS